MFTVLQKALLWSGKAFLSCGGILIANNPKCVHHTKNEKIISRKKNTAESSRKKQFIVMHGSSFLFVNAFSAKSFLSCEEQDGVLIIQWCALFHCISESPAQCLFSKNSSMIVPMESCIPRGTQCRTCCQSEGGRSRESTAVEEVAKSLVNNTLLPPPNIKCDWEVHSGNSRNSCK